MQRILISCLSVILVIIAILAADFTLGEPAPESKDIELRFDKSALKTVKNGERDFLVLRQPKCVYPADPEGAPIVPSRLVRIAVPRNAVFHSASISACTTEKLAGPYELDFVRAECPPGEVPPATEPDAEIYGGDAPFPAEKVQYLRTGMMRGCKIFFLRVNPVQYLPKSKELLFHGKMTLKVEYTLGEEPDSEVRPARRSEVFGAMLERAVENPDEVANCCWTPALSALSSGPLADGGPAAYLIICCDAYKDAFQPLADWKKQKGLPSKIVTVESIETDYTGADTQEKIKRCIIDHVNNNGTDYVLLGGDIDTVPHRGCYLKAYYYTENNVPCDLYYAGLDDVDWNDDSDSMCAELEADGDTIDLEPDVLVGRCSCGNAADAQAFVDKTLEYERRAPDLNFGREIVLTGIRTWSNFDGKSDVHTWSLRMYDDCIAPFWSPDMIEFFDTTPSLDLSAAALKSEIDNGHGMLNMMTHGQVGAWSMEGGGEFGIAEASSQTNDLECGIIYTIACHTNWFDSSCLSEAFTRNAGGGAVAYIGCSRYGWGDPYSYLGGRSIILNRTFYLKLLGEDLHHLGEAYAEHKWEHAGECLSYNPYRWIQLGINLIGDPELPVWTSNPQAMSVIHPSEIAPGSQTIYIKTEPGAVVCLWKTVGETDEVYAYGEADENGGYSAIIDPATVGTLKLTATKHNFHPFEADITVTDNPSLYVATAVLPDGEAGAAYSATLEAGGGTQPYAWSISSGTPPDGLTLDGTTIQGTPSATGSWTFTVQVEDASYDTATAELTLDVSLDAPDLLDFVSPDYDGSYSPLWTGSDAPTHYELQEATSITNSITDNAESGTSLWLASGFTVSAARSYSSSQSFYGGNGVDTDNSLEYADSLSVGGTGQVSFWCWYDIEDGISKGCDFSFFEVSLNGGSTWIKAATFSGNSGGWVQKTIDLSTYAGRSIRIRFRSYNSHQDTLEGFYVDDIEISGLLIYDWSTLSSSISDKYYDVTGRGVGTYYYRIRAFDGTYTSSWSEIKSIAVEDPLLDLFDNANHTVSLTTVCSGQTFSMGLDVGRTGPIPAGTHKTSFYFSTDDNITDSDYLIGGYESPGFGADFETQSISVLFPESVPEGTYYLGCLIDAENEVGETDEANNAILFAEQVTVEIKYELSVSCSGSGSVSADPDKALYDSGEEVELTALPDTGWQFDRWEGDLSGATNPATVLMNDNISITAVFVQTEYTLTLDVLGGGTVAASPLQAVYYYGNSVTVSATPDTSWAFDHWEGSLSGSANPATVLMNDNISITAVFVQTEYTLTLDVLGGGTVAASPLQATYHYGDSVAVSAEPSFGWGFSEWQGDLTGIDNPGTINIDGNKTVTALFTAVYIPPSKSEGGCSCSISGSENSGASPEDIAGYFLPFLLISLCMAFRKTRRNHSPFIS